MIQLGGLTSLQVLKATDTPKFYFDDAEFVAYYTTTSSSGEVVITGSICVTGLVTAGTGWFS